MAISVTELPYRHWLRLGKSARAPSRSRSDGRRSTRERGRPARMHSRCLPLSFPAMGHPATLPSLKRLRMTLPPHDSRRLQPGPRNLVTDVEGFRVGNASDAALKSGTTVLTAEQPFTAAVHVMGGAPGSRETDLLAPGHLVRKVDALVLSGGSAFGLDAASGVADAMAEAGRGFPVGTVRVPIVPAAILFDLLNGGDKNWKENPYRDLGRRALENSGTDFDLGTAGAGAG